MLQLLLLSDCFHAGTVEDLEFYDMVVPFGRRLVIEEEDRLLRALSRLSTPLA